MVAGIGIDLIECERVLEKISRTPGFKELVFSRSEIFYCEGKANPAELYAARFSAKEALLKALGIGLSKSFRLNEIEILNTDMGAPYFSFSGNIKGIIESQNITQIHVSLSHLKDVACAVVIIEKKDDERL